MKSEKKVYIIFVVVMAVLYRTGYLVGRGLARGEKNGSLEEIIQVLTTQLTAVVPPLFLVLAVVSLVLVVVFYLSCRRKYLLLQENPDDDLWDQLELEMNRPLIFVNTMQILNVFFLGCIIYLAEFFSYGKNGGLEAVVVILDSILLFVILLVGMLIPHGVVRMEEKLNPEKKGNVFDFKFHKVWLESCDEAQKMITYQAAYYAFMKTNITCIILSFLAFIGMLAFKVGIWPMFCICMIWLVNNLSYMIQGARLESGKVQK